MSPEFNRFILTKILRWKITPSEDTLPREKKIVFLFAPHTSIWDFVCGYFYFRALGGRLRIMIKKEAFKGPFGWMLKKLGGYPIDRKNPSGALVPLIHEMNTSESFYLAICPEGTRKAIKKWKTGYHTIVKETSSTLYLSHVDYKKREIGFGKPFTISDNAREDTAKIQSLYAGMHLTGMHPDDYKTE